MTREITTGDELRDTNEDAAMTVVNVHDDGDVSLRVWRDQRHGQEYYDIREDGDDVLTALDEGIFAYDD